jgi:hypothetical protein
MLRSYNAVLNGSDLVWVDSPPPDLPATARVLVVFDDTATALPVVSHDRATALMGLAGQLTWQGDAVATQRMQRDAW